MIMFSENTFDQIMEQINNLNQSDDPIIFKHAKKKLLFDIEYHKIQIDWNE